MSLATLQLYLPDSVLLELHFRTSTSCLTYMIVHSILYRDTDQSFEICLKMET